MLNIKEVALKIADSLRNKIDGISHMQSNQGLVAFAEALISAYKAELLKEVGEPVAEVIWFDPALELFPSKQPHKIIDGSMSFMDSSKIGTKFYTSDQVAAAILKVTEPLKEDIARYCGKLIANAERTEAYLYENNELRAKLAAQKQIANETAEAIDAYLTSGMYMVHGT